MSEGLCVSVKVAGHVARCDRCAHEVGEMLESLRFVHAAPTLEPPSRLTANILLAAKNERRMVTTQQNRYANLMRVSKGFAMTAVALVMFNVVGSAGRSGVPEPVSTLPAAAEESFAPSVSRGVSLSEEDLEDSQLLRTVVMTPSPWMSISPAESATDRRYRMKVEYLEGAISDAMEELSINPGLRRANRIVTEGNHQLFEELKAIYVERPL